MISCARKARFSLHNAIPLHFYFNDEKEKRPKKVEKTRS